MPRCNRRRSMNLRPGARTQRRSVKRSCSLTCVSCKRASNEQCDHITPLQILLFISVCPAEQVVLRRISCTYEQ